MVSCQMATPIRNSVDYRHAMRTFVVRIAEHAHGVSPEFAVVPQNGHELLLSPNSNGSSVSAYLDVIGGIVQEDLFYGGEGADSQTLEVSTQYLLGLLDLASERDKPVLVLDYASTNANVMDAVSRNTARGYIPFVADTRSLDSIPPWPEGLRHDGGVAALSEARNFLCLLNPGAFDTRNSYLEALRSTDHDVLVLDLFYDGLALTAEEVGSLKRKASGGERLVLCYMSIGEAEDYRFYWEVEWAAHPPDWLDVVNPDWPGNFKVRYWDPGWQNVILGSGGYLDRILEAGYDGVYLDIIDAFEYFEAQAPKAP